MIIVPCWVEKEEPTGIFCVLGSEPEVDAELKWLPRESIINCIYGDLTEPKNGRRIAVIVMDQNKLPEKLKQIVGM